MGAPSTTCRWACLLRGINVGGHRSVKMAELRAALSETGLANVTTYVQSGNVVFDGDGTAADVAAVVGGVLDATFGLDDVPIVVRSSPELDATVTANPFSTAEAEPKKLHVYFCDPTPDPARFDSFDHERFAPDQVALIGSELYVAYDVGAGSTKLTLPTIEKALDVRATGRNWTTVLKLQSLARAEPPATA